MNEENEESKDIEQKEKAVYTAIPVPVTYSALLKIWIHGVISKIKALF